MAIKTRAQKKREEEAKALEEAEQKDPSPNPDIQRQEEDPNPNHSRSSPSSEPDEPTPISRWHGIPWPQFYIPRWRIRAGVPTVVLKPINVDARFVPTNDFSRSPDDVASDTQSSHSVSDDSDAATSDSDHYEDKNDIPILIGSVLRYDQIPPGQEDAHEDTPEQDDDVKFYENNDVCALAVEGLSSDPTVNDWDFEKWGESLTKFVRSPFGPEGFLGGGWQGVKPLGRGGFAMAALWERTNEDNDSVDVCRLLRALITAGTNLRTEYSHQADRQAKSKKKRVGSRGESMGFDSSYGSRADEVHEKQKQHCPNQRISKVC